MTVKLKFLGAAESVTGSAYLLESNNTRLLIDCGMFHERPLLERNWNPFSIPPDTIDAVLLTHAHVDHCGLLPKLVREGFKGGIYCTGATGDITQIMLLDSARLQEEDAEFKRRRHERENRKGPYLEIPLYTTGDASACFPLLRPVDYASPVRFGNGIEISFHDAGHVLGSSMVKVKVSENGRQRTVLFSGDLGRRNKPILRDPTFFSEADYVIIESTYGERIHGDSDIGKELAEVINSTAAAGGNIIVPSFALERSQELMYYLNKLLLENRIPHTMVFIDSPMAVSITEVFERHPELFDKEMVELLRQRKSPFDFPGLNMVRSVDESKAVNHIKGTVIVIAGSGMCNGGRVKHHLVSNISRAESTILFVGYQARSTLGRQIVDGASEVRILGQMHRVKARIARIDGFSGHADRDELLEWLSNLRNPPKHIFVTHGDPETSEYFSDFVKEMKAWEASVPRYLDEVMLE
ncbi:MAG: MBL fold metallo-hydrolase [Chloroflexi bacterium]|nr:MBL fold metallo-hydrolase [Chloroflexota bacterium]